MSFPLTLLNALIRADFLAVVPYSTVASTNARDDAIVYLITARSNARLYSRRRATDSIVSGSSVAGRQTPVVNVSRKIKLWRDA